MTLLRRQVLDPLKLFGPSRRPRVFLRVTPPRLTSQVANVNSPNPLPEEDGGGGGDVDVVVGITETPRERCLVLHCLGSDTPNRGT
jgi:hypothetical protein